MKNRRILSFILIVAFILTQINYIPVYAAINGVQGLEMVATDTIGEKPKYNGEGEKILTNLNDINLKGDSRLSFKGTGIDLNDVQYQFMKTESKPTEAQFSSGNWAKLDPTKNEINKINDVVTDKQGYLTWRSYNVQDMPTVTDTASWADRTKVYKTPNTDIKFQSTAISDTTSSKYIFNYLDAENLIFIIKTSSWRNTSYKMLLQGTNIDIQNSSITTENNSILINNESFNNKKFTKVLRNESIWFNGSETSFNNLYGTNYSGSEIYVGIGKLIPKTIFYQYTQNYQRDKFEAYQDYKESSKFWGYITVPQDGYYQFGLDSDDGSYGYIKVDNETKEICLRDNFITKGANSDSYNPSTINNNKIYLTSKDVDGKPKYYPIYLEYFNWGGDGKFVMVYKYNTTQQFNNLSWTPTVYNWFYPSRTNTPGEYAESTFEINEGVDFPKAPGKYYVAVKSGDNKGIYGPFIVPTKANLTLSREVVDGNNFIVPGEEFEFKYTIKPQPIPIVDVGNSSTLNTLTISNFKIQETFPSNIIVNSNNTGQASNGVYTSTPRNIVYTKSNGYYVAPEVTCVIKLKTNVELNNLILGSNNSAFATYKDLDDSNPQQVFGEIKISTTKLQELRVLEVQPERSFELSESMFSGMAKNIELVQMSMPEFISNIEEINGNYDVVYVGNVGNKYTSLGNRPTLLPQGGNNGTDSSEYYSENDITNLKAEALKEFINSGQLTIFANSVFNVTTTKLSKNFKEYKDKNVDSDTQNDYKNFISTNNIIGENIKQLYNTFNKRPILTIKNSPKDYEGSTPVYENSKVMNFTFDLENLNTTNSKPNLMDIKLYLDLDGDGFFRTDEMVKQIEPKLDGKDYTLDYGLLDSFTGMMPWKLEVEDRVTHTKTYKIGYPAYKGQQLKVRVLHLIPANNELSISKSNSQFKPDLSNDIYDITVTELPISQFNNSYPNDVTYNGKVVKTRLNGNYDMIIMGFADTYGSSDLTNINAVQAIKDFIKTGQSVMFTHDVFTFQTKAASGWGANLTKQFRDISGQSRYKDSNNPSELDVFGNTIVHDVLPNGSTKTYGFTDTALDRADNLGYPEKTETYKLNKGTITDYPYVLPEVLPVATTHYQYFQLNLEDKDVVPWYTLNIDDSKRADGRNYYYTYSKGNITYSGTGHSAPNGEVEQELFVNTMIKASRNANHAPTLQVINLEGNKLLSKSQKEFDFGFIANDIDGDMLTGDIYIDDKLVRRYNEGDIKLNEPINVTITQAELENLIGNKENFTIKVSVKDSKGAIAEENGSFTIGYYENPIVSLESDGNKNYLLGDEAEIKLKALGQNSSSNLKTKIENINYSMVYDDTSLLKTQGESAGTFNNISFNPSPSPASQEKLYKFQFKKEGNFTIKNTVNYDCPDFSSLGIQTSEYTYPISVKKAEIHASIINSEGIVQNLSITVTRPGEAAKTINADKNGHFILNDNLKTGTYTFLVNNLPLNYIVKDGELKTVDLSYDNPVQEVNFELVDKNKIGIDLTTEGPISALVGDEINLKINASAHNEDSTINTTIENIRHSLSYDNTALELTTPDSQWNLSDVNIVGKEILSNKDQYKNYSFKVKSATNQVYDIVNTLVYNYFDTIIDTRSTTHKLSVKAGRINIKIVNYNGTPFANVPVKIVRIINNNNVATESVIAEGNTDSIGNFNLANNTLANTTLSSGNYKVLVELPTGYTAEGGNSKAFALSYSNAVQNVEFKLSDSASILKHGLLVNNLVNENSNGKIVKGFSANFGVDFKVYDTDPDVRLTLDKSTNKAVFTLYRINDNGTLSQIGNNLKIYQVKEETVGGITETLLSNINTVDFTSIPSDEKANGIKLRLNLPYTTTFDNHYILGYKIYQNANVGSTLINKVKVNDCEESMITTRVIPLPILQ